MNAGSFHTRNYGRFSDEYYNKLPSSSTAYLENMETTRRYVKTSRNAGPPHLLPLFCRRKNSEEFMGVENFLYGKSFEAKEGGKFVDFEPENIWKGSNGAHKRAELPSSRQTTFSDNFFSNKRKLSSFADKKISSDISTEMYRRGKLLLLDDGNNDDNEDDDDVVCLSRVEHDSLKQMKLFKTFKPTNTMAINFLDKFNNDEYDSTRSQVFINNPSFSSSSLHSLATLTANCYKNERSTNSSYASKLGLTPERSSELSRNRNETFERSSTFDIRPPRSKKNCTSLFRNLHSSDNADNTSPTPGSDYSEVSCRQSVTAKEGDCVESKRNDDAVCLVEENNQQIVNKETANYELKCGMCTYSGKSRNDLTEHLKSTHSTFQCNICNFSTRSQTRLTRHVVENHSKFEKEKSNRKKIESRKSKRMRRYTCKQCPFSTSIQEDIWSHTRVHVPASKLLTCPRCPFVCAFKHHMQYHLNNHFGFKPYKCDLCNYRCNNKSMLNSHLKSHSNEYPFKCHKCSYASKYRQALYIHGIKSNHMQNDAFHNSEPLESTSLHLEKWNRFQKDSITSVQSEEINYASSVNSPVDATTPTTSKQPVNDNSTTVYKELKSTQTMEKKSPTQTENAVRFTKSFQLENLLTKENDSTLKTSLLHKSISVEFSEHFNNLQGLFLNSKTGQFSRSEMEHATSKQVIPFKQYERVSHPSENVILDLRTNQRREEMSKENQNLMKCHHCQITFEDLTLFQFHLNCHTPGFPFKCKLCGQLTDDRRQFFVHLCQNSHSVASTKQLLLFDRN